MKRLVFIAAFLTLLIFTKPVLAEQDSSGSADLQSKLDQLKSEIASKAASIKSDVGKTISNKAFPGTVKSQSDTQMVMTTSDKDLTVLINKYTDYQYVGKVTKAINSGDFVIGLGDVDDKGNLVAKRIIKMGQPQIDNTRYIFGVVQDASSSAGIITQKNGQNLVINFLKNIEMKLGKKTVNYRNLIPGEKIISVGDIDSTSSAMMARYIYIYPDFQASATPSPTAKPTATASASATKK